MNNIPQINNGKTPDEPFNARLGFWLPSDTPYGNFTLKLFKIIGRVDELNRQIKNAFEFWDEYHSFGMSDINIHNRHSFSIELAVYIMRRVCDELISLVWCLNKWEESLGSYPPRIKIDCIGAVIKNVGDSGISIFTPHLEVMTNLNNISNAFKHSFVHTDTDLVGANGPRIYALDLRRNSLSSDVSLYDVSLTSLVNNFGRLYYDAKNWLQSFSSRHRQ